MKIIVLFLAFLSSTPLFAEIVQFGLMGGAFNDTKPNGSFGRNGESTAMMGAEATLTLIPLLAARAAYYQGIENPNPALGTISLLLRPQIFRFAPWVGVGVGIASTEVLTYGTTSTVSKGRKTNFCADLSLGVDMKILDPWGIGFGYHFIYAGGKGVSPFSGNSTRVGTEQNRTTLMWSLNALYSF